MDTAPSPPIARCLILLCVRKRASAWVSIVVLRSRSHPLKAPILVHSRVRQARLHVRRWPPPNCWPASCSCSCPAARSRVSAPTWRRGAYRRDISYEEQLSVVFSVCQVPYDGIQGWSCRCYEGRPRAPAAVTLPPCSVAAAPAGRSVGGYSGRAYPIARAYAGTSGARAPCGRICLRG